jgi:hypothetical protein
VGKDWLTHEGMWFYHTCREFGIEKANEVNKAAIKSLAPIEMDEMKRLLGITWTLRSKRVQGHHPIQFGSHRQNPIPHQTISLHPLEAPVFLPMTAYRPTSIGCAIYPLDTQAHSLLRSPHQKASSNHSAGPHKGRPAVYLLTPDGITLEFIESSLTTEMAKSF